MNKLTIIGNLTKDPERRVTQSGTVAAFTVAVNQGHGERKTTLFFNCSAWERTADNVLTYLHKGSKVAVVGPVSARAYTPNSGGDPRAVLEVNVREIEFLSGKEDAPATMDIGNGITATVVDDEAPF
jgi:single-strand DNA-binding protein